MYQMSIQKHLREKYDRPKETDVSFCAGKKIPEEGCHKQVGHLMKTVYFLAKQGFSFRKYSKLINLQEKNNVNLGKRAT